MQSLELVEIIPFFRFASVTTLGSLIHHQKPPTGRPRREGGHGKATTRLPRLDVATFIHFFCTRNGNVLYFVRNYIRMRLNTQLARSSTSNCHVPLRRDNRRSATSRELQFDATVNDFHIWFTLGPKMVGAHRRQYLVRGELPVLWLGEKTSV